MSGGDPGQSNHIVRPVLHLNTADVLIVSEHQSLDFSLAVVGPELLLRAIREVEDQVVDAVVAIVEDSVDLDDPNSLGHLEDAIKLVIVVKLGQALVGKSHSERHDPRRVGITSMDVRDGIGRIGHGADLAYDRLVVKSGRKVVLPNVAVACKQSCQPGLRLGECRLKLKNC